MAVLIFLYGILASLIIFIIEKLIKSWPSELTINMRKTRPSRTGIVVINDNYSVIEIWMHKTLSCRMRRNKNIVQYHEKNGIFSYIEILSQIIPKVVCYSLYQATNIILLKNVGHYHKICTVYFRERIGWTIPRINGEYKGNWISEVILKKIGGFIEIEIMHVDFL